MKAKIVFFFILASFVVHGQINIHEIDKSMIKLNEKFYVSKYELTNKQYNDFILELKQSNKKELLAIAQIDTLKWRDGLGYNEPYVEYYHAHPAFKNYPVVNISYDAALLYCNWLTDKYNATKNRKFKKIFFRLPTEEEWKFAAQAGDTNAVYACKENNLISKKNKFQACFKKDSSDYFGVAGYLNDSGELTTFVKAYRSNKFGIYNMSGNVAEMTAVKGLTKGGSWKDTAEFLKISSKYFYDGLPQTHIGFRLFMDVLEK